MRKFEIDPAVNDKLVKFQRLLSKKRIDTTIDFKDGRLFVDVKDEDILRFTKVCSENDIEILNRQS